MVVNRQPHSSVLLIFLPITHLASKYPIGFDSRTNKMPGAGRAHLPEVIRTLTEARDVPCDGRQFSFALLVSVSRHLPYSPCCPFVVLTFLSWTRWWGSQCATGNSALHLT